MDNYKLIYRDLYTYLCIGASSGTLQLVYWYDSKLNIIENMNYAEVVFNSLRSMHAASSCFLTKTKCSVRF